MIVRSKLIGGLCALALAGSFTGCGTNGAGPQGRLVQGPVVNATVFADNAAGGVRFVQDANEVYTFSNLVTGDYILPSTPSYNYILVSKGGTDKLTNQAAIQLLAPAGSANITPLTTLVALDTTGTVKAKLQALMPAGASYDADISVTASRAVLLVAKSVETMVQSLTDAIVTKAGSGNISANQLAVIQAQTIQAIATQFANPAVTAGTMAAPATLSASLQAAATTAVTSINAANSNINIPSATATAIASSSVTATAAALSVGATATTTAISGGETAVMTASVAQQFVTAVTPQSATASATIAAAATPTNYTPPVVPVSTPGVDTTGTTGGTTGGTGTSF